MVHRMSWIAGLLMTLAVTTSHAQPMAQPGPEHQVLRAMEGTWNAVMTMGPTESKGVMTYQMDMGGLWLLSTFEGDFNGMKFKGHGVDGYNPMKKKYVSVWVDSWTPVVMHTEGDWDPENRTLTMMGETPSPDGTTIKTRMVTTMSDKDHMEFKMYGPGPDGAEMEMMTISYSRRS